MAIDRKFIEANHADIVAVIRAEGHQAGRAEGLAAGVEAERTRILAVEAAAMPGCEGLVAQLKADGKSTGPEAAAAVLAEYKKQNQTALDKIAADAKALEGVKPAASPTGDRQDPDKPAKGSAEAFDAAVSAYVTEGKLSRGQAIKRAAQDDSKAHAAWIARANERAAA